MSNKKKWTLAFKSCFFVCLFVCYQNRYKRTKGNKKKKKKTCLLDSQKKLLSKTDYFVWYVFYLVFGDIFLLVLVPFCLHRFELHLTKANKTKNIIIHVIKIITEILSDILYKQNINAFDNFGESRKTKENIFVVQNH